MTGQIVVDTAMVSVVTAPNGQSVIVGAHLETVYE